MYNSSIMRQDIKMSLRAKRSNFVKRNAFFPMGLPRFARNDTRTMGLPRFARNDTRTMELPRCSRNDMMGSSSCNQFLSFWDKSTN